MNSDRVNNKNTVHDASGDRSRTDVAKLIVRIERSKRYKTRKRGVDNAMNKTKARCGNSDM